MRWLLLTLLTGACVSEEDARREGRRAASAASDAIAAGLILTETFGYIDPRGTRHGPSKSCPSVELIGSESIYVMLLDYEEEGCAAESEWVPWLVGGHYWVDVDQEAVAWTRLEEASMGGVVLTGAPAGSLSITDIGRELEVSGTLGWSGSERTLDMNLLFDGRDPSMTMSGTVETRDGILEMTDVGLHRADVTFPCPVPRAGAFAWSGDLDLELELKGSRLRGEAGTHNLNAELCGQGSVFAGAEP